MQTITRARALSLSHLHWMTWCRRPRLSASHQVFSRSVLQMPTAHSLASAQSTARCVFVWTTVSGVTKKMTTTASTPGAPVRLPRQADMQLSSLTFTQIGNQPQSSWNSRPVALLVLLLVLISAAGDRLISSRSSPGTTCLGSSPQLSMAHSLHSRSCRLRDRQFPCGERPSRHPAPLRRSPRQGYFCARLHVHVDPRPILVQVFLVNL